MLKKGQTYLKNLVSFYTSSYCMSTEAASALMFQNFEKYIKMSSIFNKLATIGQQLYYKRIPVFQGF